MKDIKIKALLYRTTNNHTDTREGWLSLES
jgi:hypothetical protein